MDTREVTDLYLDSERRWRKWAWITTMLSIACLATGRIMDQRASYLAKQREYETWAQ